MSIKKLSTKQAEIDTDDLLIEILIRLPSYSIYRLKSICKQWHSLITSSLFRKLRARRLNVKPPTGLILQYSYNDTMFDEIVSFSSDKSKTVIPSNLEIFIVKQSCNGLLLCTTSSGYHVYNPTTNTYVTLPYIPSMGFNGKLWTMSLAFDPNESSYYKVIFRLCKYRDKSRSRTSEYHIYSSQTRCWTLIPGDDFQCSQNTYFKGHGIYCNGSINWINPLLSFSIENRSQKAMPTPLLPQGDDRSYYFGESCGRLNYTRLHWRSPCTIDVCELKSDNSRWMLKYTVILKKCPYYHTKVLSVVHGTEDEDDSFLVLKIREKIVRYNLVSKTSEELLVLPAGTDSIKVFQHFESQCGV